MSVDNIYARSREQWMLPPAASPHDDARDQALTLSVSAAGMPQSVVHASNAGTPAEQSEKGRLVNALI